MSYKAVIIGRPMKLELTRVGLQENLANHNTTRGDRSRHVVVIYKAFSLDVASGHMNEATNETQTHLNLTRILKCSISERNYLNSIESILNPVLMFSNVFSYYCYL